MPAECYAIKFGNGVGGIDGRKGSDHSHGSMIGAKGRDRRTTLSIGG
jgi:hypothetical protein